MCWLGNYAAVVFFEVKKPSHSQINSNWRGVSKPYSAFACTQVVLQCLRLALLLNCLLLSLAALVCPRVLLCPALL